MHPSTRACEVICRLEEGNYDAFWSFYEQPTLEGRDGPAPVYSRVFKSFIEGCLRVAPERRLTAAQALAHPWLADGPIASDEAYAGEMARRWTRRLAEKAGRDAKRAKEAGIAVAVAGTGTGGGAAAAAAALAAAAVVGGADVTFGLLTAGADAGTVGGDAPRNGVAGGAALALAGTATDAAVGSDVDVLMRRAAAAVAAGGDGFGTGGTRPTAAGGVSSSSSTSSNGSRGGAGRKPDNGDMHFGRGPVTRAFRAGPPMPKRAPSWSAFETAVTASSTAGAEGGAAAVATTTAASGGDYSAIVDAAAASVKACAAGDAASSAATAAAFPALPADLPSPARDTWCRLQAGSAPAAAAGAVFEAAIKHLEAAGAVVAAAAAGWQLRAVVPSRGVACTARFYVDDGSGSAAPCGVAASSAADTPVAAAAPASIFVDVIGEEGPQDEIDEVAAQLFDAVAAAADGHCDAASA